MMPPRLGYLLLVFGLLGHVLAAYQCGAPIAYVHHILGFFLILFVTGGIILMLGRFLWKGRPDITFLVIGAVQALFGVVVYILEANH